MILVVDLAHEVFHSASSPTSIYPTQVLSSEAKESPKSVVRLYRSKRRGNKMMLRERRIILSRQGCCKVVGLMNSRPQPTTDFFYRK